MSDLSTGLLMQLKDYANCNDELALKIRKTILEPFQVDLTRPDTIKKPPPTPTRFKQMATQLAPIAMRIVNQNIENLVGLKRATSIAGNYTIAVNCLVDTSFYALTALRHMNTFTALKPLDIEKTTSNLICKMVELGEYNRALDEIRKFRSLLASVAKVQLDNKSSGKQSNFRLTTAGARGFLTESPKNYQSNTRQSLSPVPDSLVSSQWEEEMLIKYRDLFNFPLDQTINDRTMILLVLAYQMNALRCWCEINEGALAKFLPCFMERPGNFIDWSEHLMSIDPAIAKKHLDSFQKLLYKAASKYPLNESTAFHSYNVQTVALEASKISGTSPLRGVMDRLVRIGVTYEKSTSHTQYHHIQQRCQKFLETVSPNVDDNKEMDSYFVLCEYLAYVSRKSKNHEGALSAYQFMTSPLRKKIEAPTCSYYHAAYAASAKLSEGSLQMDKMVAEESMIDIYTALSEAITCLNLVSTALQRSTVQDDHTDAALTSLCKSMDGFRQSSKRLYELVSDKTKQTLMGNKNNPFKTPPHLGEIATPTDFGAWNSNVSQIIAVLQQCSETLPANLNIAKKKTNPPGKRGTTQSDIMISFIDIMVLLTRMHFNINNDDTHSQAYEYLSTAEQLCAEVKFPEGYRWLSVSYYNLGALMIKTELFSSAVYPLRKSCTLLEKDTERVNTDEGKLQICKRYEILGTCCQKNERYTEAIRAYRMALQRAPISVIEKFITQASTTAVSTIVENDPLIPKLIDRFLRASIIDPDQSEIRFACEFLDLSTLSVVQQCIIYECELRVWNALSLKMDLVKFQMMIIEKLLECYDSENFPVRRARVLLSQVRIERSRNSETCTRTAMACAQEAIQLLKVHNYGCDTNLLKYRVHYLGLASSWVAICARELNEVAPNNFFTTLQQWGILLKRITPIYNSGGSSKADIRHVYESVDDLDQFYDHVRMLVDLFGVTGQYVYQINALRMLLKLNNGLRDVSVDHVSESIILSSTIGRIYCDLGYTGKASAEFKQAQNAINTRPCNNTAELVYRVNYAYYLAQTGDYETAKEVFDSTKLVWECGQSLEKDKNALATAKAYTSRCMLLADIYNTKALLLAQSDTLDSAIVCSTGALQLLNKCIKIIQKANEGRQEKKQQSTELENPFMPTQPPQAKEEAEKIVFRESQWVMAQKISSSLASLASLHMRKGSWNEAKYFVKQGPLLAEKVNSNALFFNSYLCASEFHLRCGDYSQSQDDVEKALSYQPEGRFHEQESARLKVAMADLAIANNVYVEAIDTYGDANIILQELCSSSYISSLEQLSDIKEPATRGSVNSVDPKVTFEDQVEKADKYDCVPLQKKQYSNAIKKALALSINGDTVMGLDLLDNLGESGVMCDIQVEHDAAISSIRMKMLREEISSQPDAKVLLQDSLSLPPMKVQVARGAVIKKSTVSHERRMMRDNLANNLESMVEAHRLGYNRERLNIIQSLCNQIGFGIFFKNQFSPANTRVIAKDAALLSSYYMEMAKGISMRREMQFCLDVKMNKIAVGQTPSDTKWPVSDEKQDELSGRFSQVNLNPKWLQAHLVSLSELYREEHELNDEEFQQKFIDILPVNWTVCSLTLDPINHDLYAVQMRAGEPPFVVKIPLNRSKTRRNPYDVISYNDAVTELQDIIQASDETIHNSDKTQPNQVDAWWDTRTKLDKRLKVLVESIENQWFSGFKGLLSGRTQEHKEELVKFQKLLSELVYKSVTAIVPIKKQVELSINFCRMVLRLGRHPTYRDMEDLIYFALTCYEAQEIQIDHSKIDMQQLVGKVKVLIVKYHGNASGAGVDTLKIIPNDHVILILDKHLQMFPMESIPILRPQPTSRLPCLSFLRDRILYTRSYESRFAFDDFGMSTDQWKDMFVSRKNAFYVLNPGGDLKDTQKEFESIFRSVPEWDGITETMPIEFQCKDALQSRDIYMYFGHSAGQAFMRGTTVRQLPTCAVSLLMGCSSGVLEANGEFDPYGYILNYLLAGSPAVVGNLWDVTDRSIDRLTKYMLSSWGLLKSDKAPLKPKSLVQAVTESRSQGKLPYLIGAAPVVYGIPVYIDNTT